MFLRTKKHNLSIILSDDETEDEFVYVAILFFFQLSVLIITYWTFSEDGYSGGLFLQPQERRKQ